MKIVKRIVAAVCLGIAWHSCIDSELVKCGADIVEGEPTVLSLSLKMATMGSGPITKSTDPVEKEIRKVRVLVFNEKGTLTTNKAFTISTDKIDLNTYSGNRQTLFVVANATDAIDAKLVAVTTLTDAQNISESRENIAVGEVTAFATHDTPLMMTGVKSDVDIAVGTAVGNKVTIPLEFLVAKLTLNVSDATDKSKGEEVVILGWDLVDEPVNTFICKNEKDVTSIPEDNTSHPEQWYNYDDEKRQYKFEVLKTPIGSARTSVTKTMYLLENRRGGRTTRTLTTEELKPYLSENPSINDNNNRHKALYAPYRATYIAVYAVHKTAEGSKQVKAKIYIGTDAISDYNVVRGNHYTFNVTVTGWNKIDVDSNVSYTVGDFSIEKGTDLTMDTHPDFRALKVNGPEGYVTMEIVNNDAVGTRYNEPGFNADWLKMSPLNLINMQQKQTATSAFAVFQEKGINNGSFAHARYYPHKKERIRITNEKRYKWWNEESEAISNFGDEDNILPFEKATRRMCYQIHTIPLTPKDGALGTNTLYLYAEENLQEEMRSAKIKFSYYTGATEPGPDKVPDYVTFETVEQMGYLSIYNDINDPDEGMYKLNESGVAIGAKKKFVIERFEEADKVMDPSVGSQFQKRKYMQWGFSGQTLYQGLDKFRNGRFMTAHAVFQGGGVTKNATTAKPEWSAGAVYREVYGSGLDQNYTKIAEPYTGGTSGEPYFYPNLNDRSTYHPIYNSSAARYCYEKNRDTNGDGKIDQDEALWYLPSRDQMLLILVYSEVVRNDIGKIEDPLWGAPYTTDDDCFWTSTEDATPGNKSFLVRVIQSFSPGTANEAYPNRVRCVRDID